MYMTSFRRAPWTFGYPSHDCLGAPKLRARHDDTSDNQRCVPLKVAGGRALDVKYGYPLLHVNGSDLRPFAP